MGCWGYTAFESDDGMDAASLIRSILPEDGPLEINSVINAMILSGWYVPDEATGASHTGPMALAEIITKFLDSDVGDLDYDEEWAADDKKFRNVASFLADKPNIKWLRDYINGTVKYANINAEQRAKRAEHEWDQWNGWRSEESWLDWKNHMSALAGRLDALLDLPEDPIELVQQQEQTHSPVMG